MIGRKPVLITGLATCALASIIIPFSPSITVMIIGLSLFGAGAACLSTAPTAIVGDVSSGGGAPLAYFQMFADVGSIISPLVVGAMADIFPMWVPFSVGAVILAGVAVWSAGVRIEPEPADQ